MAGRKSTIFNNSIGYYLDSFVRIYFMDILPGEFRFRRGDHMDDNNGELRKEDFKPALTLVLLAIIIVIAIVIIRSHPEWVAYFLF